MATQLATTDDQQARAVSSRPESPEQQHFALMQRKAAIYAASPLIPETLRAGGPNVALANCYIALNIAERMNENELTVLQNIHIVKGKAGFSAQFMIARANASGVFKGRINWRMSGAGDTLSAEAFATLADTGEEIAFAVDMAMARAEGWTSNPKYKSIPHLMLRYRSATFLVRLYAPDVMFGYRTTEEVEDMAFAGELPGGAQPLTAGMLVDQSRDDAGDPPHDPETGEIGEFEDAGSGRNDGTLAPDNAAAAEGPEDGQRGEAHAEEEPLPPYQALVDDITERATKATILGDVIGAENDFAKHRENLPDTVVKAVDAAIAAGKAKFAKGAGK